MKKLFAAIVGMVFTSLFVLEGVSFALSPTSTVPPTPIMVKVDYQLAYPGILPDNPLYKVKVLRDKIVEFFTMDPKRKVDFYLLQTDKQMWMVQMLAEKKEINLAKMTALKAEDNFTKLVFVYRNNGSRPDSTTYKTLEKAAQKHQELLTNITKNLNADDAKVFQQVINFSKTNWDSLIKIYQGKM